VTASTERPLPIEDEDTRPYWEAAKRGRLELPRCNACGKFHFPPRPRCPTCLSPAISWTPVSGRGEVHSFTVIHVPVIRGFETPYAVAQIELAEQAGLLLTANIVDCPAREVRIGMGVEVIFEDCGGVTLPQFRAVAIG
jgi:uncharacterized OB-fold protein